MIWLMSKKPVEKKQVATNTNVSGKVGVLDATGKLDEFDFRTIQALIDIYDHTFPFPHHASIDFMTRQLRKQRKDHQEGYSAFNELSVDSQMRHTMCIPEGLLAVIKVQYPNIIRDKVQYRQFLKKFPRFRVSERY